MNHQSIPPWIPKCPEFATKMVSEQETNFYTVYKQRTDRMIPTSGVPRTQSRMWSQAELAADNALDSFLALIIAAPRC